MSTKKWSIISSYTDSEKTASASRSRRPLNKDNISWPSDDLHQINTIIGTDKRSQINPDSSNQPPALNANTCAHTFLSHTQQQTCTARIFFSRALGVLTGLYWLTRRNTTRTRLLIILFWLAFIAQYKEWKGPNVAVSIPSYRKGRGRSTHCCPHLVMIANMLQLKKN